MMITQINKMENTIELIKRGDDSDLLVYIFSFNGDGVEILL